MKGRWWGTEYGAQFAAARRLLAAGFPALVAFRLSAAGYDVTGCWPVVDDFPAGGNDGSCVCSPSKRAHDASPLAEAAAAPAGNTP